LFFEWRTSFWFVQQAKRFREFIQTLSSNVLRTFLPRGIIRMTNLQNSKLRSQERSPTYFGRSLTHGCLTPPQPWGLSTSSFSANDTQRPFVRSQVEPVHLSTTQFVSPHNQLSLTSFCSLSVDYRSVSFTPSVLLQFLPHPPTPYPLWVSFAASRRRARRRALTSV
jgi:hypothetical protein